MQQSRDMPSEKIKELDAHLKSTERNILIIQEQLTAVSDDLRMMLDEVESVQNDCLELMDCLARIKGSAENLQIEMKHIKN